MTSVLPPFLPFIRLLSLPIQANVSKESISYLSDGKDLYKVKSGDVLCLCSLDHIASIGNTMCIKEGRTHRIPVARKRLKLSGQLPLEGIGG